MCLHLSNVLAYSTVISYLGSNNTGSNLNQLICYFLL